MFVNYPVWESVEYFNQVTSDPAFRSALERYPESTAASPHLFRKVAVRGICGLIRIYTTAGKGGSKRQRESLII